MPSGRRPACASRRARRPASPASAPIARLSSSRAGPVARRRAGRIDTAPDEPGPGRVGFRPARVGRLLGLGLSTWTSRNRSCAGSGSRSRRRPSIAPTIARARGRRIDAHCRGRSLGRGTGRARANLAAGHHDRVRRHRGAGPGQRLRPDLLRHLPATTMPGYRPTPLALRDRVRGMLAGFGLQEVVNHALVSPRYGSTWAWTSAPTSGRHRRASGGNAHLRDQSLVGGSRGPAPDPGRRARRRDRD